MWKTVLYKVILANQNEYEEFWQVTEKIGSKKRTIKRRVVNDFFVLIVLTRP